MNNIKITEEEIEKIKEFAKTNPDDFEYIILLSQGHYGWAKLSSGKTVYISPPQVSGKEVGAAFKKVFDNMQREDSKISKLLKEIDIDLVDEESQQMKNLPDILGELSQKWNDIKN